MIEGAVVFHSPLISISRLIFGNDSYSHIALIPLTSIFFIWVQRRGIFSSVKSSHLPGAIACISGLTFYAFGYVLRDQLSSPAFHTQDVSNDYLSLCMAGAVCWVVGSFLFAYGVEAFRRARFALLFLLFAVPIPTFLLNGIIKALQVASAEAANLVFQILPVSYYRDGLLVFRFPNVAVEVAEQCSGIRSSLVLFILSVITGKLFLKRGLNRAILAFSIFPITVFKNALRITTITLLANYVDMKFLTNHWIHNSGGIPFFGAAIAMFIPVVWLLRKGEMKDSANKLGTGANGRCKCQSVS